MGVRVRCFQCKVKVQGKATGGQHAQATGHVWQPGYYCTDCLDTFTSHKECKKHIDKEHKRNASIVVSHGTKPQPEPDRVQVVGHSYSVNTPRTREEEGVNEHTETHFACNKCNQRFSSDMLLREHYTESPLHPTCHTCGLGFESLVTWATHKARCPPPRDPQTVSNAQTGEEVQRESGRCSSISNTRDDDVVVTAPAPTAASNCEISVESLTIDTTVEQSSPLPSDSGTISVYASASSSISLHDTREPQATSIHIGNSCVQALSRTHSLTADMFSTPFDGSHRATTGELSAITSEMSNPSDPQADSQTSGSVTNALTRSNESPRRSGAASNLSFHCRVCLKDHCRNPVATVCGHVFCQRCIIQELAIKGSCPVCQRTFFVKLKVNS
ncbi:hypothetical protein BD311DRAFT_744016 [Dichomitus squalens]|uniref:RING-type domain-containing protein n=1 Tax=Dichomitus squalens TaxID=114155 RepID=A0A4Q9N604_9APHY|nr:hypothetical protein BD311DRAFT_744016 [Dichomitus squalens]